MRNTLEAVIGDSGATHVDELGEDDKNALLLAALRSKDLEPTDCLKEMLVNNEVIEEVIAMFLLRKDEHRGSDCMKTLIDACHVALESYIQDQIDYYNEEV